MVKKQKTINRNNFVFGIEHMERKSKKPTQTVKGMAYTIPQLFARFASGDVMAGRKKIYWPEDEPDFDDHDLDQVSRMDIEDRHAVMQESAEAIARHEAAVKRAARKKAAETEGKEAEKKQAGSTGSAESDPKSDSKNSDQGSGSQEPTGPPA